MTERELYENVLIELNKVEAPSFLFEDFIYFGNKAVQQYTNQSYNKYEAGQQATDDLRALKITTELPVYSNDEDFDFPKESNRWYTILPDDYLHLLNCIIGFQLNKDYKNPSPCDKKNDKKLIYNMARKATSDTMPTVLQNAYFKPSYKTPYYILTKVVTNAEGKQLDVILHPDDYVTNNTKLEKILNPCSVIDPDSTKGLKLELRCGDSTKYIPAKVYIDYIKTPRLLSLTRENLEEVEDHSEQLEFPEYVCYEIVNNLTKLILENTSNPRLQTNFPINQTIGLPVQPQD